MTKLHELASLVRSKNAGPFQLTIDVLFDDATTYQRVCESNAITSETIAKVYDIPPEDVEVFHYPAGRAIKVTFPRKVVAGSPGDPDVSGGQQYGPLVDFDI
jgi:hypothetical protein